MSTWQDLKTERNRQSVARLTKALPQIFPPLVLRRALGRPFVPPTPRLAIDSYWRAHPLRADRLARALATKSGAPDTWTWRLGQNRKSGLSAARRGAARALSRSQIRAGSRILLRVRAGDFPPRLACRSVGDRPQ